MSDRRGGPWAFMQAFLYGGGLGAIWLMPQWQWTGDVRLAGSERPEVRVVANASADARPLFLVDPARWREPLERDPAIAQVQVHRWLFPPRVEITVKERVPVARVVDATGMVYLDRGGRAFPLAQPQVVTWSARLGGRTLSATESLAWRELLAVWPGRAPVQVDLRDPASWSLHVEGVSMLFGAPTRLADKVRAQAHLRPLAQAAGQPLRYLDLRFPETPTVRVETASP